MPSAFLLPAPLRSSACALVSIAGLTAVLSGAGDFLAAPASASTVGQEAVVLASHEAGSPYMYGASGPNSFDCSGLVSFVYRQLGISLPHNTTAQYAAMPHVARSAALPGDIVFVHDAAGTITHDGIYAGNGLMWAAPHTGEVVKRQLIYTDAYYVGRPSPTAMTTGSRPRGGPATTPGSGVLQQGSTGPQVADLQRQLGITPDGAYGPATAAAVQAFQGSHGLVVDGVAGPATRTALNGIRVQPVGYAIAGELRQGSSGAAVIAVQKILRITADGQFGPLTKAAVVAYQRAHALVPDGVVGPRTRAALSAVTT